MTDDTWKIIPKRQGYPLIGKSITLKINKTKKSFKILLSIPLYIRKKSAYFETPKMYCNLLEKNSLIMIQFVPREKADSNSHSLYHGSLLLSPLNFKSYLDERKERIEVSYLIDNGNIIIDRETLKDAKEIEG